MMPDRKMFWRIIRRLFAANRGRLFVILLALGAGAAITAALLNLQVDAKRRLTTEFRTFGANVIVSKHQSEQLLPSSTMPESVLDSLPTSKNNRSISAAAFLYATVEVNVYSDEQMGAKRLWSGPVIVAGYRYIGNELGNLIPYKVLDGKNTVVLDTEICDVGEQVAKQSRARPGEILKLRTQNAEASCVISEVRSFGGSEDSQVFVSLKTAQRLASLAKQVSLLQLSVPGTPAQIETYIAELKGNFPNVDVRPIRQFTEGEAKIYSRISGILSATVGLVLVLTVLCVMAAMTNVAMERRNDVGLMKAIGGATRRVLRLFLAEAALLGLAGGVVGASVGILLSMLLGKAVFGIAARPRLIVYPVAVALTIIVAIAGAYPLRRLANIRPAAVFRGEA
jgi:putative ABC transport system permease protein